MIKRILLAASIYVCALTAGCSTHVVVMSEHPSILIKPLPYKIGLVLNNSFTNYSFTREKNKKKIIISLGDSQTELFKKIFDSMFSGCVPVYWGAKNIGEYVPSDCFIDRRDFKNHSALLDFLKAVDANQFNNYSLLIHAI